MCPKGSKQVAQSSRVGLTSPLRYVSILGDRLSALGTDRNWKAGLVFLVTTLESQSTAATFTHVPSMLASEGTGMNILKWTTVVNIYSALLTGDPVHLRV